jgi:branched-subunit amino acid transport protein AzlD
MELTIGSLSLQLSETQYLAMFWAVAVALAFNIAYLLFVWDRNRSTVTRARMLMTILLGSLVVVGTYADALAAKPFAMKDCLLLALVAAHGWMAEELVQSFMAGAAKQRRAVPTTT